MSRFNLFAPLRSQRQQPGGNLRRGVVIAGLGRVADLFQLIQQGGHICQLLIGDFDPKCRIRHFGSVYGDSVQQLEQKRAMEAYLTRVGNFHSIHTAGWYMEQIGGRLYLMRSVTTQKAALTAAIDLRMLFEELLLGYGLDGQVLICDQQGQLLLGEAEPGLLDKVHWKDGYGVVRRESGAELVVRRRVQLLEVYYLTPYEHRGVAMGGYEMLLVLASVFVITAIPFLFIYVKQEIFRPMNVLVNTMDRISSGDLSARPDVDYRNAEFT